MTEDQAEDFTQFLIDVLNECHNRGMELPWLVVVVGINGSLMCLRYTAREEGGGLNCEPLHQHIEGPGFNTPINMMIVDSTGEAARVLIDSEGLKFH